MEVKQSNLREENSRFRYDYYWFSSQHRAICQALYWNDISVIRCNCHDELTRREYTSEWQSGVFVIGVRAWQICQLASKTMGNKRLCHFHYSCSARIARGVRVFRFGAQKSYVIITYDFASQRWIMNAAEPFYTYLQTYWMRLVSLRSRLYPANDSRQFFVNTKSQSNRNYDTNTISSKFWKISSKCYVKNQIALAIKNY